MPPLSVYTLINWLLWTSYVNCSRATLELILLQLNGRLQVNKLWSVSGIHVSVDEFQKD